MSGINENIRSTYVAYTTQNAKRHNIHKRHLYLKIMEVSSETLYKGIIIKVPTFRFHTRPDRVIMGTLIQIKQFNVEKSINYIYRI